MNCLFDFLIVYKKYVLYVVLFALFTIIGFFTISSKVSSNMAEDINLNDFETLNDNSIEEVPNLFIHIDGAVENPGIKEVSDGTRIFELIEIAGGLKEDADISRINLASKLKDEQKIIIPYKISEAENTIANTITKNTKENSTNKQTQFPININYATKEELIKLNGIGDSMAQKIIDYREENGYYDTIEDIKNVSGIGEAKFNRIKDDISV